MDLLIQKCPSRPQCYLFHSAKYTLRFGAWVRTSTDFTLLERQKAFVLVFQSIKFDITFQLVSGRLPTGWHARVVALRANLTILPAL